MGQFSKFSEKTNFEHVLTNLKKIWEKHAVNFDKLAKDFEKEYKICHKFLKFAGNFYTEILVKFKIDFMQIKCIIFVRKLTKFTRFVQKF